MIIWRVVLVVVLLTVSSLAQLTERSLWIEVNHTGKQLQNGIMALITWSEVTDTVIISTTLVGPPVLDPGGNPVGDEAKLRAVYKPLRAVADVCGVRLIGGLKLMYLLPGAQCEDPRCKAEEDKRPVDFANAEAWARIAHAADLVIELTGSPFVLLEAEGALRKYMVCVDTPVASPADVMELRRAWAPLVVVLEKREATLLWYPLAGVTPTPGCDRHGRMIPLLLAVHGAFPRVQFLEPVSGYADALVCREDVVPGFGDNWCLWIATYTWGVQNLGRDNVLPMVYLYPQARDKDRRVTFDAEPGYWVWRWRDGAVAYPGGEHAVEIGRRFAEFAKREAQ